tara:strand:- start:2745 stop:3929 length:1185 start_codon:yes stop_codon:yes gene_type:complete
MDNPLEEALKNSGYTLEDSQSMETEEAQPEIIDATALNTNAEVEETITEEPKQEVSEGATEPTEVVEPQQTVEEVTASDTDSKSEEVDVPQSSLETAAEPEMTQEQYETNVTKFIGEKLGIELDNLDQLTEILNAPKQTAEIDERVKAISDFVSETGRDPKDWFTYQSLNPSEMDDLSAVKLQMAVEYPNLDQEEINMLMGSKYKIDEDLHSEDEIKLSKLQLKIDAQKSRKEIEQVRDSYKAPVREEKSEIGDLQSPITKEWITTMSNEVDSLDALTFELGDTEFNFGIKPEYRSELKKKNENLDQFFDQYVGQDGNWDFEMLNAHRTVIDNIDDIAKSLYNQGLSDGQRKLVEKTANVDVSGPKPTGVKAVDSVREQILAALSNDSAMKFKL